MVTRKRITNTVKQLLPRKLDLHLVIVVILVGLLLCYLSKEMRLIEGVDNSCSSADDCPSERPFCVGGVCSDTGPTGASDPSDEAEPSEPTEPTSLEWSDATSAFDGANFQTEGTCVPIVNADPSVDCGSNDEDSCGPGSSGGAISQTNCRWSDCSEVYSMTGTLEGGYFQTWMDECLFGNQSLGTVEQVVAEAAASADEQDKSAINEWTKTSTIPLSEADTRSESIADNIRYDFLSVFGLANPSLEVGDTVDPQTTLDTILRTVKESSKIPKNYKPVVRKKIQQCADGWLQNSSTRLAYKDRAGGRPIMGYNSKDGLKCRNSFYQTTEMPTSESRLIFDSTICDTCPCEPPSHCGWAEAVQDDNIFSRVVDGISHSIGGNQSWCRVPACRAMYSATWCGPSAVYDTFADTGETVKENLPSFGGSSGKCSSN